jgi:hypothetical protein
MSLQHANPDKHGITFGEVVVTVDLALGDCVVRAPQRTGVVTAPRKIRLNSLDEIQGAYQAQLMLAQCNPEEHPHAADIARALQLAGQRLKSQQGRKRT